MKLNLIKIAFACVVILLSGAGVAEAATTTAALKTKYAYFSVSDSNYGVNTGCFSSESGPLNAMLGLVQNGTGKCNVSVDHYSGPWPGSSGISPGWYNRCPPDSRIPYVGGWMHSEARDVDYVYSPIYISGGVPMCLSGTSHDGFTLNREFYYYCPSNFHLINFSVGAEPLCELNAGVADPGKTPACGDPCLVGDPISTATGYLNEREVDYPGVPGSGLRFERRYWARKWMHNYERTFAYAPASGGQSYVRLSRPDGRELSFWRNSSSLTYQSDPDVTGKLTVTFDSGGIPTAWAYVDADDSTEVYSGAGKLLSITTRSGLHETLSYDSSGRLQSVTDDFGHQLTFTYDANDRLESMIDPGGQSYVYAYNARGTLQSVTYPGTVTRSYLYNESGYASATPLDLLTGIVDESGQRFFSAYYDSTGRATRSEQAGGANRTDLVYNASGSVDVTDTAGTTRQFTHVVNNYRKRLDSVSGTGCNGCSLFGSYVYDTTGFRTRTIDFRGTRTDHSNVGETVRQLETSRTEGLTAGGSTTASTRTITTSWHASFRVPTLITEFNRTTAFTYDSSGNVLTKTVTDTSVTPNVQRVWSYTYDPYGRVLTEDGPRTDVSDITTYSYYSCTTGSQCGQLHTVTDALSHVTTFNSYNAHGRPLTVTDANGVVTTLTYDLRQRPLSMQVGGEATTYAYWPTGLLKKVTLPDLSFNTYTYDNAHRLTKIEDGAGNREEYGLDAAGNRTSTNTYDSSSALARTRSQVFNSLDQLWKLKNSAGTTLVEFGYDAAGNVTSTGAILGRTTTTVFDALNRESQITDPSSGVTHLTYDAHDDLVAVQDPRNLTTTYARNGFGDVKTVTSPDTGVAGYTFDSGGNVKTKTDARSIAGTYSYDALNRIAAIAYPTQSVAFTYDAGTNGVGRLTGASGAGHSLSWIYDALGRVTNKSQTVGAVVCSVGYAYTNGNLTTILTPSGQTLTYTYSNGHVGSISVNGTTLVSNVLYEPFGEVRQWTWGSGAITVRTHDLDGKITQLDSGGDFYGYGYDDATRITSVTNGSNSNLSWGYGYDLNDRLVSATSSPKSLSYGYDANGNRNSESGTIGAVPFSSTVTVASGSNRWNSIAGTRANTYGFDAVGNITSETNPGRPVSIGTATTTTYGYNALSQRVSKSNASGTTYFMYDEAGHLLGEYGSGGALIQETVWLGDIPVATLRTRSGGGVDVFYVHTDHLNTPRKVTRPVDGALLWRWDPGPFGDARADQNPQAQGTFQYQLRFPGQYFDAETGLHYNYFRDYDPASGRYLESDPIGLEGGINTYGYVGGNPVGSADPSGLAPPPSPRTNPGYRIPSILPPEIAIPGSPANKAWADLAYEQIAAMNSSPVPAKKAEEAVPGTRSDCPDDECQKLTQNVNNAKAKVGAVGKCRPGMSQADLEVRYYAWLELATARSIRDQKCWNGGDETHQEEHAIAWRQVGQCARLTGR